MDAIFEASLKKLREDRRQLAEFCGLAVNGRYFKEGSLARRYRDKMAALFALFRLALRHTMKTHAVTDVVIAVPSAYRKLYEYLCLERIGDEKRETEWNQKPMVPMRLDLMKISRFEHARRLGRPSLWKYFFKTALPKSAYATNGHLTQKDIAVLFKERSDLLDRLKTAETDALFRHFPTLKEKIRSLIAS